MLDEYDIIDFKKYDKVSKYSKKYKENSSNIISFDLMNSIENKIDHSFVEKEKIERVIYFNYKSWYNDMKNSFNEISIKKQFELDFNRGKYFCNGNIISNLNSIMDYLEFNYKKNIINDILMFCTQTSLAIPYYLIQKNLNKENGKVEYYLSEIPTNNNHFRVNVNTTDIPSFTLEKRMRIFKLVNHKSKTVSIVNFLLEFNLKSEFVLFKILIKQYKNKKKS